MSLIAVTQSVEINNDRDERRDFLDQRWITFLNECGLSPIIFPNDIKSVKKLSNEIELEGVILTGGNDLFEYGGNAPERDEIEIFLIRYAIEKELPLLGVCRGMQMIQHYCGVKLSRIDGHVSQNHQIEIDGSFRDVNSYHNFGTKNSVDDLKILARARDGIIEAIHHRKHLIQGIMWHPERNNPIDEEDKSFLQSFFRLKQVIK